VQQTVLSSSLWIEQSIYRCVDVLLLGWHVATAYDLLDAVSDTFTQTPLSFRHRTPPRRQGARAARSSKRGDVEGMNEVTVLADYPLFRSRRSAFTARPQQAAVPEPLAGHL
jgi:hypothetical protein